MQALWHRDGLVLFGLIGLGAAFWVWHLALCLRVVRATDLPAALRILGWLPPVTALAAYRAGMRGRAVVWCLLGLAYLVLRTQA